MDLRRIILRELARQGKSRYYLAEKVSAGGGPPSRQAVYAYLRGERDMMGRHVGILFKALGLSVRHRGINPPGTR